MNKPTLERSSQIVAGGPRKWVRDKYWAIKSHFLYSQLYKLLDLDYRLQSGLTLKVASKGEWWTYNDIFVNHEYDVAIEEAISGHSGEKPLTVLDLGGNVGYFSMRLVDLLRQTSSRDLKTDITLVEGSLTNYLEMKRRLESQDLSPAKLTLIHGLVGRREGIGKIRESAIHVKNTIINQENEAGRSVNFVDLSKLMADKSEIDLLKCDIEGAEQLFIQNYPDLLDRVANAVFEFHHELCDTAYCEGVLKEKGFRQRVLRASSGISICLFSKD